MTVETRTSGGYIIYHVARKNVDHITDSYRFARKAIQTWNDEQIKEAEEHFSDHGWMETAVPRGVTERWKAPW